VNTDPALDPDRLPKLDAAIGGKNPSPVRAKGSRKKKKQKRRRIMPRAPPPDVMALTVEDFCRLHRLSRALFYELRATGRGPRELRLGAKVLISKEAAAAWRAAREAETAAKQKAAE
jgi:hypothetical protein